MELYQRQQFDMLLLAATERFVERIVQRNAGADNALTRLRTDPQGEGVWLDEFVQAVFQDFLLDNPAGACFVLQALDKRHISVRLKTRSRHCSSTWLSAPSPIC